MRIGGFELNEPLPELNEPTVFAIVRPWIDVNNVGSLTLHDLEKQLGAKELGKLAKPGHFFDFTRYRPVLYFDEGIRRISVANSTLRYAKRGGENDILFLNLLEPHALAEVYVESVLRVLKAFKVKKYCLLGSMYDLVPHTRPLIVNGGAIGLNTVRELKRSQAQPSHYEGPTSITTLINQRAPDFGAETIWFIVSLPQYIVLEEDFVGKIRLMEILNLLYNVPINSEDFERAAAQRTATNQKLENSQELNRVLPHLETMYDLRIKGEAGNMPVSSPEMEKIFWKMTGKDFGKA